MCDRKVKSDGLSNLGVVGEDLQLCHTYAMKRATLILLGIVLLCMLCFVVFKYWGNDAADSTVSFDPNIVSAFPISIGQTASDGSVSIRLDSISEDNDKFSATVTITTEKKTYTLSSGFIFQHNDCEGLMCRHYFEDSKSPKGKICIKASAIPGRVDQAMFEIATNCDPG